MIEEVYEPIIFTSLSAEEIRNEPVWFVTLSNGEKAYQKHMRKSWLELKEWLKQNPSIFIESLCFQFRDNFHHIASGKEGYFFMLGVQAWQNGPTQHIFIGGYLENEKIFRKKFIMPELIFNEIDGEDTYEASHPAMQRGLIRRG